MARYIDMDLLKEMIEAKAETVINAKQQFCYIAKWLDYLPPADVVPKSEVDSEIEVWQELYADTVSKWEKAYEELEIKLENTKTEVAREIIKDLVKFADDKERHFHGHGVWYIDADDVTDFIAELKKKYTESEDKE